MVGESRYNAVALGDMGVAMSVDELAALSVAQLADLISNSALSEYRQACIDFGIDGDMLTRLPVDQLADALGRAGVDDEHHLAFLLAEIENVSGHRSTESAAHSRACRGVHTVVDRLLIVHLQCYNSSTVCVIGNTD